MPLLRFLHRLLPLVTPLSLLAGLALLGSLWYEARQTRQTLQTLVRYATIEQLHAAVAEQQRHTQTAVMHVLTSRLRPDLMLTQPVPPIPPGPEPVKE